MSSLSLKTQLRQMSADEAAKRLLGCELVRTIGANQIRVKIVETEAYDESDAASHSFNGQTPRTEIMFGDAGYLYIYFTYGMHYCCNIVIGEKGYGAAVLIRAVEPLEGRTYMEDYRPHSGITLSNGPAKLCQALSITKSMNGHDLEHEPLKLIEKPPLDQRLITTSTRIGISKAQDALWRFYITSSDYVSRKS